MNLPDNVRPWGRYDILEVQDSHQVKRITVNPGGRLSYQRHQHRQECWIIISGKGRLTLNDVNTDHGPAEVIRVQKGDKHRIQNIGDTPLIFIEIQTGEYFGEDDIERFEDDYGREGTTTPHGELNT